MINGHFGEEFPYTNFHDLNLDWVIKELRKVRQDEDSITENAEISTNARDEAITAKNEAIIANEEVQAIYNTIREISDTLSYNRLWGKQIAIYGDSYSTSPRGDYWQVVLNALTGTTAHVSAQGSLSLPLIYSAKWDYYNADIYIIEAGLNDVTLNTPCDTFCNTIISFVNSIRTVNPNAEIYFITPPDIPDSIMHNYVYPVEFYRQCYWNMKNTYRFGVIDGLKWQGLKYSDNIHPTNDTLPLIGKYIFESLTTFGDGISFRNDYSKVGRDNVQILLMMENGIPYLYTQGLTYENLNGGSGDCLLTQMGMTWTQTRTPFMQWRDGDVHHGFITLSNPLDNLSLIGAFDDGFDGVTRVVPTGVQIPVIPTKWIKDLG